MKGRPRKHRYVPPTASLQVVPTTLDLDETYAWAVPRPSRLGEKSATTGLLSPLVMARAVAHVRAGLDIRRALELSAISRQVVYAWREKAEAGIDPYMRVFVVLERVQAEATARWIGRLDQAPDWRAQAKLLTIHPQTRDDYGERREASGGTIQVQVGIAIGLGKPSSESV